VGIRCIISLALRLRAILSALNKEELHMKHTYGFLRLLGTLLLAALLLATAALPASAATELRDGTALLSAAEESTQAKTDEPPPAVDAELTSGIAVPRLLTVIAAAVTLLLTIIFIIAVIVIIIVLAKRKKK
jgi:hypothetical protein